MERHFTESLWLQHFRMTRPTFEMLYGFIGPDVAPITGCHRPPVPTQKRIAIALYKLATCAEYKVVGETFGVSKTTVHRCLYSVCTVIKAKLMQRYIRLPTVAEANEIAYRNSLVHLVPQVYWMARMCLFFPRRKATAITLIAKGGHLLFSRPLLMTGA